MNILNIYTDGSCKSSNNTGGWAIYCPELNITICGNEKNTTNNVMELKAIGAVFKYLIQCNVENLEIIIHSDSAYSIGSIINDWNSKYNIEYINNLKSAYKYLIQIKKNYIKFNKVKGHNKIEGNEICDFLAKLMSNK